MKKSKAGLTVIKLLITLAFAFVYFYFKLPSINLHDFEFYTFVFVVCAVYCLLSLVTIGVYHVQSIGELALAP